jgi:hypothetical protein
MKCDACCDNFTAYLEGDLTEAERADCAAHLADCPDCAAELREFEAAVSLLRALPAVELPAGLADRISAAVHAEKAPAVVQRRTRTWWEMASGLAAAAALLVGVLFWSHGGLRPQPMPGLTPPPTVERQATPGAIAPESVPVPPAATGTAPKDGTPTPGARPEAPSAPERHGRDEAIPHTGATAPVVAPAPPSPSVTPITPAPAPAPSPAIAAGGAPGGQAESMAPAAVAPGAMAKSFDLGGGGPGTTKVETRGPRVSALEVHAPTTPVPGGAQLQVLPPADCVVGQPAWLSIGVTSDIQADDAEVRVQPGVGVELAGASNGVVYRGSLERGRTVRIPVEITSSRPGTARLRVILHAEKPELNSALTVNTPAFAAAPEGQAPRDARQIDVLLAFDETPLRDAFMQIGRETGVRVVPGEAVDKRPVTIDFGRGVPLPAALRILADVGGYDVVHSRDTYRIEAKHPRDSH